MVKPKPKPKPKLDEWRKTWDELPGNVRGAIWTLLAGVGLTGMSVCMKVLGQVLPVTELVALRALFATMFLIPAIVKAGPTALHTQRPGLHVLRSLFGLGGITCFVLALVHLDLATATTLSFTRVLFMIVAAALILGEVIRWRRSIATLVGFLGVIVIVQPGSTAFDPWVLIGLAGAFFQVGVTTTIKQLTRDDSALCVTVRAYLIMGTLSALHAVWFWVWPNLEQFGLLLLMGLFSAIGQTCMAKGLKAGEASVVIPFEYSRLIYAGAFGFFIFSEVPEITTWIGAAIIVGSTLYIALREARLSASRGNK